MKIVLVVCSFGREKLTTFCLGHYKRVQQELNRRGIDLRILVVDTDSTSIWDYCKDNEIDYCNHINNPLSEKWQFGIFCSKEYEPDGVIISGSDDLLTARYIINITRNKGPKIYGLRDLLYLDHLNRQLYYWPGYDKSYRLKEPIGLGRFFNREVLDKCDWVLWNPRYPKERCLDYNCLIYLQKMGIGYESFRMEKVGEGIDIKAGDNMTPITAFKNLIPVNDDLLGAFNLTPKIYDREFNG